MRADLTNQKFGRLTAIAISGRTSNGHQLWLCQCECGNKKTVSDTHLKSGHTRSCGCLKKEKAKPPIVAKHNMSRTRLYQIWKDMRGRCERPTSPRYYTHGARGIKVCAEWQEFIPFYEWAMANGYRDNLTIERINNGGNYCPENCKWATQKEQGNNRRTNCLVEYNGEKHTLSEWATILGIKYSTLVGRINKRKWSVERAFNKNK